MANLKPKKNAATGATDHDAKSAVETGSLPKNYKQKPRLSAMWKNLKSDDQSVFRMLGCTLTLNTEADWWNFSAVLSARWTQKKIATLAYFCLQALPEDVAHDTAQAACFGYVGAK